MYEIGLEYWSILYPLDDDVLICFFLNLFLSFISEIDGDWLVSFSSYFLSACFIIVELLLEQSLWPNVVSSSYLLEILLNFSSVWVIWIFVIYTLFADSYPLLSCKLGRLSYTFCPVDFKLKLLLNVKDGWIYNSISYDYFL